MWLKYWAIAFSSFYPILTREIRSLRFPIWIGLDVELVLLDVSELVCCCSKPCGHCLCIYDTATRIKEGLEKGQKSEIPTFRCEIPVARPRIPIVLLQRAFQLYGFLYTTILTGKIWTFTKGCQLAYLFLWYVLFARYLSRFFDCLAHPNLSATLATDQK